jgi:hypothetical protein
MLNATAAHAANRCTCPLLGEGSRLLPACRAPLFLLSPSVDMHRTSPPSLDPADHHASYMTLDGRISMAGVSHAR